MAGNRIRQLEALLGVDAWHKKPNANSKTMTVHARINFQKGRLGGRENDNVEFVVQLKSAEVTARPVGPATVNRESFLDRLSVRKQIKTEKTEQSKSIGASGNAGFSLSPGGVLGSFRANAQASALEQSNNQFSENRDIFEIDVRTTFDSERNPVWQLAPSSDLKQKTRTSVGFLDGTPWDAKNEPLMQIRDQREDASKEDPPEVQITIRCRREDINISSIRYKSKKGEWVDTRDTDPRKQLLAVEFIKSELERKGLSYDDSEGNHAYFILSDLYSAPMIEDEWDDR